MRTIDDLFRGFRDEGDVAALGQAFDRTAGPLFRLALTLAPDSASAEDALQETYLAAIQQAERWDASRPLTPWLAGVLRHKVADQRRRSRRTPVAETPEIAHGADPSDVAAREELTEAARKALDELPEPYRMPALLRWQHGLEPAEIAHLTGQQPGTVRVTLHRALKRLKRRLGATLTVLPGLGGERIPRGLSTIRRELLRDAGRVAVPAARTGGVAVLAGAALLLVAGGIALTSALSDAAASGDAGNAANATASVAEDAGRQRVGALDSAESETGEGAVEPMPEPAYDGPVLEGRVQSASGEPVTGASVIAFPQRLDVVHRLRDLLTAATGVGRATVGADGRFAVPFGDPRSVLHDVVVMAPGFVTTSREGVPPGHRLEVTLRPAPVARAVIVDREGRPIAGARVAASKRLPVGVRIESEVDAVTDESGVFEIASSLRGLGVDLHIRADRYAPVLIRVRADALAQSPPVELVLVKGTPLRGKLVRADNGLPVAGARVVCRNGVGRTIVRRGRNVRPTGARSLEIDAAETDAGGRFAFGAVPTEPLARSTLYVTATKDGFASGRVQVTGQKSTGTIEIELTMRPMATVRGRVIDELGAPVRYATIDATGFGDAQAMTGVDGRYEIPIAASADGSFESHYFVRAPHGPETGAKAFMRADRRVSVRPVEGRTMEADDVTVPVAVDGMLADVTVVDANGVPVPGATVRSMGARAPWFTTDADGRCTVVWHADPVLLGFQVRGPDRIVRAEALGYARSAVRITPTPDAPMATEIVLGDAHRIAGTVLRSDGRPLAGAYVNALTEQAGEEAWWTSRVDASGAFEIEGLPAGEFRIKVQWPPELEVDRPMFEHPGPVAAGASLELTMPPDPAGPSGALEIRARDAETGGPVITFSAGLITSDEQFGSEGTSTRVPIGSLAFPALPAKRMKLTVTSRGYLPHTRWIDVPADERLRLEIELERGVSISGEVRRAGGQAAQGMFLRLTPIEQVHLDLGTMSGPHGLWVKADARYGLDSVRPGRYRVTMSAGGMDRSVVASAPGESIVVERTPSAQKLDLEVVPAGTLVVRPAIEALPSAEALISDGVAPDAEPVGHLRVVDESGATILDRHGLWRDMEVPLIVAPGKYSATLTAPGVAPVTLTTNVPAGPPTNLSFAPTDEP